MQYPDGILRCGTAGKQVTRLSLGCTEWVTVGSPLGRSPSLMMEIVRVWMPSVETQVTWLTSHLTG